MPSPDSTTALGNARRSKGIPSLYPAAEKGTRSFPGTTPSLQHEGHQWSLQPNEWNQLQALLLSRLPTAHGEKMPKQKQTSPCLI